MRLFIKVLFAYFFIFNILFADSYVDSLTLTKIKRLVQKEEDIAFAYKKYLLEKGVVPTDITTLITGNYLPKGFDSLNPFGKVISLKTGEYSINGYSSSDIILKSNLYDYYYSNKYRTYTKAPLSINNSDIKIVLSAKEKFIYDNQSKITTTKSNAKNKYYLDTNGILHWYDSSGNYKFSFDKEMILDDSVTLLNGDGTINSAYKSLVQDVEFAGMTVLYKNATTSTADEYVVIGSSNAVKVKQTTRDIGKTVIQFTRRAGGMIVNGDIYTWGNNANKITGIDLGYSGSTASNRYPVINGLVMARAKMYDNDSTDGKDYSKYYENNYFSSPNRPKFVDFFSAVYYGTCGISTKGELYCGGTTGVNYAFGNNYTHVDTTRNGEMLYRSTFFDGKTNKAKKIFANNQIWLILGEDGYIYRWGYDTGSGFSGNGYNTFNYSNKNTSKLPEAISSTKFDDITYLLTIDYRKIGALSTTGDIYIWGIEDNNSNNKCSETWENISFNLCSPTKITTSNSTMTSSKKFESIQGGLEAFIAVDSEGKYYKVYQPKSKKIQVISVEDTIKNYSEYNADDDAELLSVDFSSKLSGSSLLINQGIVWINSKNELKGDYYTYENKNDELFKNAIAKIKWKKIKVIQDDNGMCGIDVNNQMYCWGIQSFYRSGNSYSDYMGNTFMIPVFNTNLYDSNKDYLVAEGGKDSYLTNMTSDYWKTTDSNGNTGAFFMKYPTYIGGFNYEFIFK